MGSTGDPIDTYDGTLDVGYADSYDEVTTGDMYGDQFDRSGVYFDLTAVAGHRISNAVLKISALSSWHDYVD